MENKLGTDRIEIQVFPDAQLGSDVNILEGMKLGTHDALIVGSPLTNVDTKFFLFDLPYLFNTQEEVEKVTKGEIGELLNASLEEKGYVNLGYWFTLHSTPAVHPLDSCPIYLLQKQLHILTLSGL